MSFERFIRKHLTIPAWEIRRGVRHVRESRLIKRLHRQQLTEIRDYQFSKLKRLLHDAYHNVPFYKNEWNAIGLTPETVETWDDFLKVPVLTKDSIRKNTEHLISTKSHINGLIKSGTGGTTDSPIVFYYDRARARIKDAEMEYFYRWFGWEKGNKVATLWGAPQDIPNIDSMRYRIVNRLTRNNLFLPSSLLNPTIMDQYLRKLNRFKPEILHGYSTPVYLLARHILGHGIPVHSPKSVVLTAEPCSPGQRTVVEDAFSCPVFTFYGCREGGYLGSECRQHHGYHINCTSIYLEILKDGRPAQPGEIGSIVFTDLYNFDMPFIRYQVGDLGTARAEPCPCGSPLPMMDFSAGRETDAFLLPDGSIVPGVSLCDRIIEDCNGIAQLQFIQDEPARLIVNIVKGPTFSDTDTTRLDERMDNYFKGQLDIRKIFVDSIPKEKSGKTRFCISNVPKNL